MGQKSFWSKLWFKKKIWPKKKNIFWSKYFLLKKKFRVKIFFAQKNFRVKKIFGLKKFRDKKFFGSRNDWVKKFRVKKNFSGQKNFESKKFLDPKNFGSKNYWIKINTIPWRLAGGQLDYTNLAFKLNFLPHGDSACYKSASSMFYACYKSVMFTKILQGFWRVVCLHSSHPKHEVGFFLKICLEV